MRYALARLITALLMLGLPFTAAARDIWRVCSGTQTLNSSIAEPDLQPSCNRGFFGRSFETDSLSAHAQYAATTGDGIAAMLTDNTAIDQPQADVSAGVSLQFHIAEVSRRSNEDSGISLNAASSNGKRSFTSPAGAGGYFLAIHSGSRNFNLTPDWLSQNGLATILSELNLTSSSAGTANVPASGRAPYPLRDDSNEAACQLEPGRVTPEIIPTVYGQDQILQEIRTCVRSVDPTNSNAAALTERGATTTAELGSGQSICGISGLKSLAMIGALFHSSRFAKSETEPVISVPPWLVAPTSGEALRNPQDGMTLAASGTVRAVTGNLVRMGKSGENGRIPSPTMLSYSATGSTGCFATC